MTEQPNDPADDHPAQPPAGDDADKALDNALEDTLDRGLEAAFGEAEPPVTKIGGSITRRAGMTQGPPSVIDLVEKRTGRATRLMLKDEDSQHGASPMVNSGAAASEAVPTGKGNYQLMGEIARGGMGIVMKGHDTDLGRDVAMKVLLQEHASSDSILQRFVEEAQIGGQLQHPGIVPVYELGLLDDDRPYFTMKLVKGRTLAALFSERTKVEEGRRRFLTIGRGLGSRQGAPGGRHRRRTPGTADAGVDHRDRAQRRLVDRRQPEPRGFGHGHSVLHVTRAGPGRDRAPRRAHRRLLPRRDPG
jgi:hypothetical protein